MSVHLSALRFVYVIPHKKKGLKKIAKNQAALCFLGSLCMYMCVCL